MGRRTSYGQKLAIAFALTIALVIATGVVGVVTLRDVVAAKDRVITVDTQVLADAERLRTASERQVATVRRFLISREPVALERLAAARADLAAILERLQARVTTDEGRQLLATVAAAAEAHRAATEEVIALRRTEAPIDTVARAYEERVGPRRDALDSALHALERRQAARLEDARRGASRTATQATVLLVVMVIAAAAVAIAGASC
jgi:CHASE3 domain sensor protein